jgi:hypothetical protein
MKKFVGLLLCLSLSFFAVARATKPGHTPAADERSAQKKPAYVENESVDMSDAEEDEVAAEEDTDVEVASADDDSTEDAPDYDGEDVNDDDDGGGDEGE